MKFLSIIITLALVACGTQQTSEVFQQDGKKAELSKEQKEKAIKALSLLFNDPRSGKEESQKYQNYLKYQTERLDLSREVIEAKDDDTKLMIASEMNDLDTDYRIKDRKREVRNAIETLNRTLYILNTNKKYKESIIETEKNRYDEWQKKRKTIIVELEKQKNDDMKLYHASRLNQLDQLYQFQFLGLILIEGSNPPSKTVNLNSAGIQFSTGVAENFSGHFSSLYTDLLTETEKKIKNTKISDAALKNRLDKHLSFLKKVSGPEYKKFEGFKVFGLTDPSEIFIANRTYLLKTLRSLAGILKQANIDTADKIISALDNQTTYILTQKEDDLNEIEDKNGKAKVDEFKKWAGSVVDYYLK